MAAPTVSRGEMSAAAPTKEMSFVRLVIRQSRLRGASGMAGVLIMATAATHLASVSPIDAIANPVVGRDPIHRGNMPSSTRVRARPAGCPPTAPTAPWICVANSSAAGTAGVGWIQDGR